MLEAYLVVNRYLHMYEFLLSMLIVFFKPIGNFTSMFTTIGVMDHELCGELPATGIDRFNSKQMHK